MKTKLKLKKKVKIPNKFGFLEAQISINNQKNTFDSMGIILCHPHPSYGGTMANNVVRSVFQAFENNYCSVLRFNFRGVGKSDGKYSNGIGEREDVLAACKFLLSYIKNISKILIVGYSFGAAIGTSIVDEMEEIVGYVAISYPFTFIPQFIPQSRSKKQKFFLMGKRDDFTSLTDFKKEYKLMPEPKSMKLFREVDHFWIDSEKMLSERIINWFNNRIF